MPYTLSYTEGVKKNIRKLDPIVRKRLGVALIRFTEEGRDPVF
jgi:phage-related protein